MSDLTTIELCFTAKDCSVISVKGRMPGPRKVRWYATVKRSTESFDVTVGTNDCMRDFILRTTVKYSCVD